jgi:hypothetical protein
MGRDSSVDIAGRSADWIPVGGEIFHTRPDGPWNPPAASYTMGTGSFPGVKRPGRDFDHPPLSSAKVKEVIMLYLCSSSGPSRVNFIFYLYLYGCQKRRLLYP